MRIVLADANVLYSRVLRDYLLYAAAAGAIAIRWSATILDEVIDHLSANVNGFDTQSGARLRAAMNRAFPEAEVTLDVQVCEVVAPLALPDEGDRHVFAAAVAVGADVLCTDNLKDFPASAANVIGVTVMSADTLLSRLVTESPDIMRAVHRITVARFPGASDASTIAALRRAGATQTAELVSALITR